jgi:uncharacterized protein with HEPN domain
MRRDYRLYLEDILEAITRIERYTSGIDFAAFRADEMRVDAVVRNLAVALLLAISPDTKS